ncbi:hypothetical protein D3C85_1095310 [compost metagenome]
MPFSPKSGVKKERTAPIPKGKAVHNIQGLNFPQRVWVRSAITPIMILKKAPIKPPIKMIILAVPAGIL